MNPRKLFLTLLCYCLLQSLALQAQTLKFECVDSEESYQAQTYNPPQPLGNVNAVIIYVAFNSPPDQQFISYIDSLPSWYNQLGGRMQSFLQTASHGLHDINISILTNGSRPFRAADDFQLGGSIYSNISTLFINSVLDSVDALYDLGQFDNDGPDGEPNTNDDDGYVDFVSLNVLWPLDRGGVGLNISGPSRGEWISSDTSCHAGGGYIRVTGQGNGAIQQLVYDQAANEGIPMHEYGHVFGLPDMDHSSTTDLNHYSLGGFDIMAGGGFNGVASIYNPWFRDEMLGWVTPTQVTGNLTGESMTDLINTEKLLKYSPSVPSNALPSLKFDASYHTGTNQWESNWPMSDPELGRLLFLPRRLSLQQCGCFLGL